ncbi:GspH/FimT family pseudopilin [Comamonas aquatilis]|uniref:GspH/FimT family pseudopilin n=1 Tax=Comamonas aquatilis TaxID=1778406 RepID=UPI0039EDF7E1
MKLEKSSRQLGFTLVELLTVISIIAIAASLAAPSMASLIRSNRTAGEITSLSAAIRTAKSEAIKRGSAVQLCASTNGTSCSGSNAWETGWIVFDDKNGNQTMDSGETVIAKEQAVRAGDTLAASSNVSSININGEGFAYKLPAAGQIVFTLKTSPVDSFAQRCLVINQTANPAIRKKGEANCD